MLQAARERIAWTFDRFERPCVSFSGGKDSTVLLHIVESEARRRRRRFGVLFVDLEGQYDTTIQFIRKRMVDVADVADIHWVALPLVLRNAVSVFDPRWMCWDPSREADWVRPRPPEAVVDEAYYPFFRRGMEFEEFVSDFGKWYAGTTRCASMVGIRASESLNRWRAVSLRKTAEEGLQWTTVASPQVVQTYPIYDWKVADIWIYAAREQMAYNPLYDLMYRAGLTPSQQRICQPYGDDQRRGLWLFQIIEPQTWARVVARVAGANLGALYANRTGNATGLRRITKPAGKTWRQYATALLESMPVRTRTQMENKIAVFANWWGSHGFPEIPDEASAADEANRKAPSWRRVCRALLKNDYWCKTLGFQQTKSEHHAAYTNRIVKKRQEWASNL